MSNGKVVQVQNIKIDFKMEEYDVIPLEPDDRKYNRAKIKRETQKALEKYYEGKEKIKTYGIL